LYFIVVLGEGAIKLGLEHGGVLSGLASSFSRVSARSTVSPYPWSMSDFCRDLSMTSCTRQQLLLGYSFCWNSTTRGYSHVPSSIARHAASIPSCELLLPG
jgi:hypothetical protein